MQFGFCYIPEYYENRHGTYQSWYERLLQEWQTADALGFDAIWIAEHRLPGYAFCSTPVVAQAIADRTKQIRIGTAVALLPQRHPILSAEHWAAIDVLSGGRLNFGIGRGIFAYDFEAIGLASGEARERFQEAWEIIRALWTSDQVSHHGKYWSFDHHTLRPQPLQKPTPPVYVACMATPKSYQWAGANGCHLMVAPFLLSSTQHQCELLDLYRESLAKAGHRPEDFQIVGNYHLAIGKNQQDVKAGDEYLFRYLDFLDRVNSDRISSLDKKEYSAYSDPDVWYRDVEELRDNRAVVGTAQQCINRIGELASACGLTSWMFHINYGGISQERVIDQMHLFADEVMPAFKSPWRSDSSSTTPARPAASTSDVTR